MANPEACRPWGRTFCAALVVAVGQLACCVASAQQAAELQLGRSGTLAIPLSPGVNQVPPSLGSRALMTFETLPGRTQLMLSPMPLPQPPSKREVCNVVENGSSEVRAKAVEKELRLHQTGAAKVDASRPRPVTALRRTICPKADSAGSDPAESKDSGDKVKLALVGSSPYIAEMLY